MQLRLRVPSALYRLRRKSAGTNRRLTAMLVEALRDPDIFITLLTRTEDDAGVPPAQQLTPHPRADDDDVLEDHCRRQQELLRGPWRDS